MKATMRVHASALNDYELFIRGRPTNGRLTTIAGIHFDGNAVFRP